MSSFLFIYLDLNFLFNFFYPGIQIDPVRISEIQFGSQTVFSFPTMFPLPTKTAGILCTAFPIASLTPSNKETYGKGIIVCLLFFTLKYMSMKTKQFREES